jgi:FkbM family methyltransferase
VGRRLELIFPAREIGRLLRRNWALAYRETLAPRHFELGGVRLRLDPSWATPTVRQHIYAGQYEDQERRIIDATLRLGDRVLEVGAGAGYITTRACQIVGAENVTAYEANPAMAAVATETAALNGFSPAVINAALGEHDGETTLHFGAEFWSTSRLPARGARELRVPMRSFAAELERLAPTYLQIDVEGAEAALLREAKLPECVRALTVELHPQRLAPGEMRAMLASLLEAGFNLDLETTGGLVAFFERTH